MAPLATRSRRNGGAAGSYPCTTGVAAMRSLLAGLVARGENSAISGGTMVYFQGGGDADRCRRESGLEGLVI